MIFHPTVLALYLASILIGFMMIYSSLFGIQIIRKWDLGSGSEEQLILERKTYLVSAFLGFTFAFELLSLFLYVFTADRLHTLFVGAMCAAGSLHVNAFGYPALCMKIVNFLLAGLWLVLNYADNRGFDYPLVKIKYVFLLVLTPLVLMEIIFQSLYFLQLKPNIITSCCGTLFSGGSQSLLSEISSFPAYPMKIIFYGLMTVTLFFGMVFFRQGRGAYAFSLLSALTFFVSIGAILSFISLYFYELPTHHCPFCLLQKEYGYIGYPLYFSLFGGAISGMGVGLLKPFIKKESLSAILPLLQKRLALTALFFFSLFLVMVTLGILFSNLQL
jgi:hypothetical protein